MFILIGQEDVLELLKKLDEILAIVSRKYDNISNKN